VLDCGVREQRHQHDHGVQGQDAVTHDGVSAQTQRRFARLTPPHPPSHSSSIPVRVNASGPADVRLQQTLSAAMVETGRNAELLSTADHSRDQRRVLRYVYPVVSRGRVVSPSASISTSTMRATGPASIARCRTWCAAGRRRSIFRCSSASCGDSSAKPSAGLPRAARAAPRHAGSRMSHSPATASRPAQPNFLRR